VLSFIAPTLVTHDLSKLWYAHIGASRDLMELPGGALAVAVGADHIHRMQDAVAPKPVADGLVPFFSNNFTLGYQNVTSVDAEVSAPVTKQLELDLQARYDHYNLSGSRTSPKAGFKWTPSKQFALRGTYSRGFRAPNPAENGTAGQTYFTGTSTDDKLCVDGDPTKPLNFPTQCAIAVGTVQSTTPTLKPETSSSWTLGTIVEPVKGLSATLDFYAISISNQIVTANDTTPIRGTNFTPIPQVQADGSIKLVAPPVAPIAYYAGSYVNADKTATSGVDLDLALTQRLGGFGDWKSDFMVSYMNKYDLTTGGITYHLAGSHGPLVVSGDTGSPRARARWSNTWSQGPVEITGTVNYISGMNLLDPSVGVTDCVTALSVGAGSTAFQSVTEPPPGVSCRVKSFTTFDLESRYDITKQFSLHGSITNLFNTPAPLDWTTYGGGIAPYNPSLHSQGAIGRYFTVGATVTF
jgi:iron complex outermembrane receptor protein